MYFFKNFVESISYTVCEVKKKGRNREIKLTKRGSSVFRIASPDWLIKGSHPSLASSLTSECSSMFSASQCSEERCFAHYKRKREGDRDTAEEGYVM